VEARTSVVNRGTPRWVPYAAAAVLTAATLGLRLAINPWVADRPLLIIFFLPILISAWWGGLGPGLLATALTGLCTDFYLFPPIGSLWFDRSLDFAQWLFLLLEGALVVPAGAKGIVLFAHGSGSSRHSPRNIHVAEELQAGAVDHQVHRAVRDDLRSTLSKATAAAAQCCVVGNA